MPENEAQKRFDRTYISSTELQKILAVSRATILYARRRGDLPDPIVVNDGLINMWERDAIQPYIDKWKASLESRRRKWV